MRFSWQWVSYIIFHQWQRYFRFSHCGYYWPLKLFLLFNVWASKLLYVISRTCKLLQGREAILSDNMIYTIKCRCFSIIQVFYWVWMIMLLCKIHARLQGLISFWVLLKPWVMVGYTSAHVSSTVIFFRIQVATFDEAYIKPIYPSLGDVRQH